LGTVLVNGYSDYYYDTYTPQDPAWSADGARVAFAAHYVSYYYDNAWSIDVKWADGSIAAEPVSDNLSKGGPAWSPDGKTIAFGWNNPPGSWSIYTVSAAGGSSTRLTNGGTLDYNPAWSPDGTQLVFASTCSGCAQSDLYIINRDGSGLRRLTTNAGAGHPAWRATAPLTLAPAAAPAALRRRRGPTR